MKVLFMTTIKGYFDDGKQWTARRALVLNKFEKGGKVNEFVTIEKVAENITLPDGDFEPLYDKRGRISGIIK